MTRTILLLLGLAGLQFLACHRALRAADNFGSAGRDWEASGPCAQIQIYSEERLSFTDTEERLLCGDPKTEAWKDIPPYQAKFFLRGFLQERGYLEPEFEILTEELRVYPGRKSRLNQLVVSPQRLVEAPAAQDDLWRLYQGKILTPSLLNAMEADAAVFLRRKAYACVEFEAVVEAGSAKAVLKAEKLNRYQFGNVERESIPGLSPAALERFYPFSADQAFDASKLELTEKRLARSGTVQGSYFLEQCLEEQGQFKLEHKIITGPSRVLAFGLGVSSEVGGIFRARWAHNRYGPMASQLEAVLRADFRNQSLLLRSDQYYWPRSPRRSFVAEFEVSREKHVDYEETQTKLAGHLRRSYDSIDRYWALSAGPTLLTGFFVTDEGEEDEGNFRGAAFEVKLDSVSHAYERFDFLPQEGSWFRFHLDLRWPELGFNQRALALQAQHTALGRLWRWGRGAAVGGVRIGAHTTVVDTASALADLPPSVKYYGGGSNDIRGFGLRELPENNGVGALSKLLAKFELRKTHFFKPSLEAFVFYDAGQFGFDSLELSPRVRQGIGGGLRWMSPVGLLQSFIAHGSSTKPREDEGLTFFVGLGGEF